MALPCENGLDRECFRLHPEWARQVFAYRLLHVLLPADVSKKLPNSLKLAKIFPALTLPPGSELPDGSYLGPGSVFPPGWTPGDPLPPGYIPPPGYTLPPGYNGDGSYSGLDPWAFGPPGPPGRTSQSAGGAAVTYEDITPDALSGVGAGGYLDPLTSPAWAFDDDLDTRVHWQKTTPTGSSVSRVNPTFIGNAQAINGLRVYNLHNDTGNFWQFGYFDPAFVPVITTIANCTGWSDVYTFTNSTPYEQWSLRAMDALSVVGQESYVYEIELYVI